MKESGKNINKIPCCCIHTNKWYAFKLSNESFQLLYACTAHISNGENKPMNLFTYKLLILSVCKLHIYFVGGCFCFGSASLNSFFVFSSFFKFAMPSQFKWLFFCRIWFGRYIFSCWYDFYSDCLKSERENFIKKIHRSDRTCRESQWGFFLHHNFM